MQIGIDGLDGGALGIPGDPELCLMAIGIGQPIGNVVVRDPGTGLFSSLTRLMEYGRRAIGRYLDVEPIEFETRPVPRPAPAPLARLIVAIALVVVATVASAGTLAQVAGAAALIAGARIGKWAVGYAGREFVGQWRLALWVVAPAIGALVALRLMIE